MKYSIFILLFVLTGCGNDVPVSQTAQSLDEESYPYPEQSFNPDEGEWSSSDYGSGGGSGSGYGDMDAAFDCNITACVYGTCGESAENLAACECEEGYGGQRCDTCAPGYAAIGCDDCPSDFECVLPEGS
jgi:hypothetical protein